MQRTDRFREQHCFRLTHSFPLPAQLMDHDIAVSNFRQQNIQVAALHRQLRQANARVQELQVGRQPSFECSSCAWIV